MILFGCLPAASAASAEVTRVSYTEAVEPICQANTQANQRILKGLKAEVRRGKLRQAAAALAKASRALARTYAQLRAVAPPPADAATLSRWLAYVSKEVALFNATAKALKADKKVEASRSEVQLIHNANLANNLVLPFSFHYCRFEPSRFT